jgi:multicomponent Na+:H+ antiporter subunit D
MRAMLGAHAVGDRANYAAAVLGRPAPRAEPIDYLHPGATAVALGLVTVLGAIALTAILLGRLRLPFAVPAAVQRAAATSFERVRRQHSGQLGDYLAWATVGFALLGGLFAAAT